MPGTHPTFKQLTAGTKIYDTDMNNFAPSVGFAWTPARKDGMLGSLMGRDGDFERNVIPFWAVWTQTRPGCRCKHRDVDDA